MSEIVENMRTVTLDAHAASPAGSDAAAELEVFVLPFR
jgi:hypothetical protein